MNEILDKCKMHVLIDQYNVSWDDRLYTRVKSDVSEWINKIATAFEDFKILSEPQKKEIIEQLVPKICSWAGWEC